MSNCGLYIDKTGVDSNHITVDMTLTCASERIREDFEVEDGETAHFITEAADFKWGIVEFSICHMHLIYDDYHNDDFDGFLAHLSCHR